MLHFMKIQFCSDLHLEFRENSEYMTRNPIQPEGSVLLLAGDVVPFAVMDKHNTFFDRISDQFEMVYWIPGNHEYYHSDLLKRSGELHEKVRDNVLLVNNRVVEHGHVRFIFSTLWSKISPARQWEIQQGMADFQVMIMDSKVDYWIYGHHHQFVPEFTIGTTRLITNQLGYVKYKEHLNFDRNRTIDISY